MKTGDSSPGSNSGLKGTLVEGFTEVTPPDKAANLGDSDILRKGVTDATGVRNPIEPAQDPSSQDWQRGKIDPLKSDWTG
ncbi:MAG TPA: hypothetical protein VN903_16515 [Polyangia bacterium]|nr:hypothetical protein [Polyangia bacterium]